MTVQPELDRLKLKIAWLEGLLNGILDTEIPNSRGIYKPFRKHYPTFFGYTWDEHIYGEICIKRLKQREDN